MWKHWRHSICSRNSERAGLVFIAACFRRGTASARTERLSIFPGDFRVPWLFATHLRLRVVEFNRLQLGKYRADEDLRFYTQHQPIGIV